MYKPRGQRARSTEHRNSEHFFSQVYFFLTLLVEIPEFETVYGFAHVPFLAHCTFLLVTIPFEDRKLVSDQFSFCKYSFLCFKGEILSFIQ